MSRQAVALVTAIGGARKALQLYPPQHPRFREALDDLVTSAGELTAAGPFVLNVHQGRLYDGSRVLPDDAPSMDAIADAMESRRIESLTFHPGFDETDALALGAVLSLKASAVLDAQAELTSRNAQHVVVACLEDDEEAEAERREREEARRRNRALYAKLIGSLRSLSGRLTSGEAPAISEACNVVESVLGRLLEDQSGMLGLATFRARSEAELYHSVNVMIYSLAMGATLGLPDEGLASLGMSALMHDIGKAAFDLGDPEQAAAARYLHPEIGAQILVRIAEDDQAPMLVAYEHHMGNDGSGFPERDDDHIAHPFSRIVAIADRYERLTKPDANGDCLTPDRALMTVLREAGRGLDPLFARLLARALGVFPVGCVVRLSDDRVAVVRSPGNDPVRPQVCVLYDEGGLEYDDPLEFDLSEGDMYVVEVVDQDALALEVSERL